MNTCSNCPVLKNAPNCTKKECRDLFHTSDPPNLRKLYKPMRDAIEKSYNACRKKPTKVSNSFLPGIIKDALKGIAPAEEEQNLISSTYDSYKTKKIDLVFKGKMNIAVEIKSTVDFNAIGAALFEAIIVKKKAQRFYIVGIKTYPSTEPVLKKLKNLIKQKPMCDYISGIVILNPYYKDSQKDVEQFVKLLKKNII